MNRAAPRTAPRGTSRLRDAGRTTMRQIDTIQLLDKYLSSMSTISYTAARENLAATMDRVCDDHEPVVITRQRQRSVVIMALEDYRALEETSYLLRSPSNARRLLAATRQLAKGKGRRRKITTDA
jgi:antitoxin YefM